MAKISLENISAIEMWLIGAKSETLLESKLSSINKFVPIFHQNDEKNLFILNNVQKEKN